jgi:excisionase family DNA binding protein
MLAELLAVVDGALTDLDTGQIDTARARLQQLAEAVRPPALLDLLRDIRDELRYLRQEIRDTAARSAPRPETDAGELLTVEQVAAELQVIPPTVRAWIQSGALPASRPGNGKKPGRKYRVRRTDLEAFVAASRASPAADPTP